GQDANVHSRDHQDVIRARTLEIDARVPMDESVVADDHRIHQCGLRWRPELMHFADNAAMDPSPPAPRTRSCQPGKNFYSVEFRRSLSDDSPIRQRGYVVKRSRIPVVARPAQFRGESQAFSIEEYPHGYFGYALAASDRLQLAGIHIQPQAKRDVG